MPKRGPLALFCPQYSVVLNEERQEAGTCHVNIVVSPIRHSGCLFATIINSDPNQRWRRQDVSTIQPNTPIIDPGWIDPGTRLLTCRPLRDCGRRSVAL